VKTERGASTRQLLIDAAVGVFAERGYARATTKEIAKAAGVAEGTIYRHFSDKKDLFQAAFIEKSSLMSEEFVRLPELAGRATVRDNLERFMRVIEDLEETIAPLQASAWSDADLMHALAVPEDGSGRAEQVVSPLEPLSLYIRAEQELGRIRKDADADRAAFAIFSIPFAAVMMSRMTGATRAKEGLKIMETLDVVLGGLLAIDTG